MAKKERKIDGQKRGHGNRTRRAGPLPTQIATVRRGNLPPQHVVRPCALPAGWSSMSRYQRSLYCRICRHQSSNYKTRDQHTSEVHIGHRCHYPLGPLGASGSVCGAVFRSEASLLDHLNAHVLPPRPMPNNSQRVQCGWPRRLDCVNVNGFSMQQNMLRHVRKHQATAARAAGDIVFGNINDSSDSSSSESDSDDDIPFDPPSRAPRGPKRGGGGPGGPPPGPMPQQVAAC
ncbi:hypothetical protein F4810DRAFT_717839 [Camillea tinctor]|nr:hypothetical protein F4810DRAFT_717839 [Camillea tinctor]